MNTSASTTPDPQDPISTNLNTATAATNPSANAEESPRPRLDAGGLADSATAVAPPSSSASEQPRPSVGANQPTLRQCLRKPRNDAKLLNLPEDQRQDLIDWLLDGMSYGDARILVEAEFGIQVRCLTRFSEFWYRFCAPLLLKERQEMVAAAHTHAALAPADADALDAASFDSIRQRAYTMATAPSCSLQEMNLALAMIAQVRSLEDNRRRLELEQARALSRQPAAGSASKPTATTPATTATSVTPPPAAPPRVATPAPCAAKPAQPKLPRRIRRAAYAAQHRSRATKPQKCQGRSPFNL